MKFSPYRNPAPIDVDWDLIEEEDYVYDSDDSEEWEFPVRPLESIPGPISSTLATWDAYERDTKNVVTEALAAKYAQISKLNSSISSWSQSWRSKSRITDKDDSTGITELLESIRLEQEQEDEERRLALLKRNESRADEIESAIITEVRKAEEEKKRAEAAEAERKRRVSAEQEEARRRHAEEEAAKAKAEQARIAAETAESESQAKKVAREKQEIEAEARSKIEAERQRQIQSESPAGDALKWRSQIETLKREVLQRVTESPELKNFCHRARLKINPRVGQVTNSIQQIGQVSSSLKALFDEAGTKDPEKLAQRWCLNFFCKAIVRQAEGEVMVKPTACYPLAFLAISLMKHFPELKDIYLCRLAKKCPWTIPYVEYDKGTESGRKSLGWKRSSDGKYEATTAYTERQEGIFRLWVATTSLKLQSSPYPIEHAWKFISRLLNAKIVDEELRNVSFVMAASFLDIAGKNFLNNYGNQANKMIRCIALWVGPDIKGPNASRLRILVEEYVGQGKIGLDFEFER